MRRSLRAIGLVVILAAVAIAVQAGLGAGRRPTMRVEIISPPAGVSVPVGQAVEVRYRVLGAAAAVELWHGDELLATDPVESGQEVSHAWAATEPGRQCIEVRAVNETDKRLAHAELCLVGLPAGSPVRLGVEK